MNMPVFNLSSSNCGTVLLLSFICGDEISLYTISQFQNMTRIYYREHRKKLRYFHMDII